MRTRCLILAVTLGLVGVANLVQAGGDTSTEQVSRLIDQLGSPRYADRGRASRALEAVGGPALPALRQALECRDREVSRRARDLVVRIEKRLEAAALLAPTRVHLVCKDVPLTEAVARLAKLSKYDIQLHPAVRPQTRQRRITLDTGTVTFWEALDQLCKKAELVDSAPRTLNNPYIQTFGSGRIRGVRGVVRVRGGFQQIESGYIVPAVPNNPGQILLSEPGKGGELEKLPTLYAGAARIRLRAVTMPQPRNLPPITTSSIPNEYLVPVTSGPQQANTWFLQLEVTLEPRLLEWRLSDAVRLGKARDDQGQDLKEASARQQSYARGYVVTYTVSGSRNPYLAGATQTTLLRLGRGEKKARELKELRGTLIAQVRTPPEALVTVENVLKAAGKTVEGKKGGSIKVLEADKDENGNYRIRFILEPPAGQDFDQNPYGFRVRRFRGGFRIRRLQVGGQTMLVSGGGGNVSLTDAQGRPFRLVGLSAQGNNDAVEQTMTFQPPQDGAKPSRLVYTGQRVVSLDLPFSFQNVKLP